MVVIKSYEWYYLYGYKNVIILNFLLFIARHTSQVTNNNNTIMNHKNLGGGRLNERLRKYYRD